MTDIAPACIVDSEEAMLTLAALVAGLMDGRGCVYLTGGLGMGKTTFSRGWLRAMGHEGNVKSPTYTLVEPYFEGSGNPVYHFDLYRLDDPEELEFMGIRDYFQENTLCLVEWPDKGAGLLPPPDLVVDISPHEGGRFVRFSGITDRSQQLLLSICEAMGELDEAAENEAGGDSLT